MKTKRNHEGYLCVDHRESPGLTEAQMKWAYPEAPAGSGRALMEAPVLSCTHCTKALMVNPLRTRDRAWCRACDAYICDDCKLHMVVSGEHRPMAKICDEVQERFARGLDIPIIGAIYG